MHYSSTPRVFAYLGSNTMLSWSLVKWFQQCYGQIYQHGFTILTDLLKKVTGSLIESTNK